MKLNEYTQTQKFITRLSFVIMLSVLLFSESINAQLQSATMRVGRYWTGITDNGYRGNFTYTAGFFPNDYNVLGWRGQYMQANSGSGFQIGTARWTNPYNTDSVKFGRSPLEIGAVHDMVDNDFLPVGIIYIPVNKYDPI
jgi:hypothetical protein